MIGVLERSGERRQMGDRLRVLLLRIEAVADPQFRQWSLRRVSELGDQSLVKSLGFRQV